MYPGTYAAENPDKIAALLVETGETLSYGQLDERSVRLAHVLREAGLRRGDVVALVTENSLRAFEVYWAAIRSGLHITAVNCHLTADEIAYIVNDSGASALVVSATLAQTAIAMIDTTPSVGTRLAYGGAVTGHADYEAALDRASAVPYPDQPAGVTMLYSSGTTGRPKGIRLLLPETAVDKPLDPMIALADQLFGIGADSTYLSLAPIYHAAPLRWCGAVQALGGTVVMVRRFDAETCLRAIADHRVTHAQFVPTMFVRMLKLPEDVQARYDTRSLRVAVHAAAPCPVEVKQRMIEWWGPILVEYYACSEGVGMTMVDSATWLERPGTVGRPVMGIVHVCDDDYREVRPGDIGTVYFELETAPFEYHNDEAKTRGARHPRHPTWSTVGDLGYVDDDGFLFLTDRKAFTIISGGVNIYPQEIENVLALHPAVHDVGVIGVPDPEMGESVTAFVQPTRGVAASPELEREIIAFVKSKIASFKAPRNVHFVDTMPRTPTGKLVKRDLRTWFVDGEGQARH
jgi:long-chain acyl-CoA synthetase